MISPSVVGWLSLVLLVLLLLLRMPLVFAFLLAGSLGILYLDGMSAMLGVLGTVPYGWGTEYILITVPMFILMGDFAFHSGISGQLYDAAQKWFGRLPGSLALAAMAACTLFAACTGSSVSSAAAMGAVSLPEMKRYNYDDRLATATVVMGGTLGILIPPSAIFVIYAVLTGESIGKLFIAGILPGLMLSFMYMALIIFMVKRNSALAPRGATATWKEKLSSLKGIWGMGSLFLFVIGGIWGGIFTPTEAAALGSFGALILLIVSRRLSKQSFFSSLLSTLKITGMVMAIIIGAMVFNHLLTISRLPANLSNWIAGLHVSRYAVLALVLLLYIPLGMFMDVVAMLVFTVPVLYPIMIGLGFDGIWFGVLVTTVCELGLVTPPVGMNCFVIAGVAKDVSLEDVFRGVVPFVLIGLLGVVALVAFPQISLWLPSTMLK